RRSRRWSACRRTSRTGGSRSPWPPPGPGWPARPRTRSRGRTRSPRASGAHRSSHATHRKEACAIFGVRNGQAPANDPAAGRAGRSASGLAGADGGGDGGPVALDLAPPVLPVVHARPVQVRGDGHSGPLGGGDEVLVHHAGELLADAARVVRRGVRVVERAGLAVAGRDVHADALELGDVDG